MHPSTIYICCIKGGTAPTSSIHSFIPRINADNKWTLSFVNLGWVPHNKASSGSAETLQEQQHDRASKLRSIGTIGCSHTAYIRSSHTNKGTCGAAVSESSIRQFCAITETNKVSKGTTKSGGCYCLICEYGVLHVWLVDTCSMLPPQTALRWILYIDSYSINTEAHTHTHICMWTDQTHTNSNMTGVKSSFSLPPPFSLSFALFIFPQYSFNTRTPGPLSINYLYCLSSDLHSPVRICMDGARRACLILCRREFNSFIKSGTWRKVTAATTTTTMRSSVMF